MESFRQAGIAAVFVVCVLQPRHAEARELSTPQDRARFVSLVRLLERNPLAENANVIRQQLREWTIEVPDIRFKACPALLGQAVPDVYPYSSEIKLQVLLSGAVLTIEDPGKARDDFAVYAAGVEGALRAYQVLVTSTPDARLVALDELVEKRDRGELVDHIARLANERCEKSNLVLIAAPIGAAVGLVLALVIGSWFGIRDIPERGEQAPEHFTTRTATAFRTVVLVCAAYYAIVVTVLHFLEPEYDPRYHPVSDYAWSANGWLMTTTFFVLGLALLTVAVGIRNVFRPSRGARTGFGLLAVGALCVCLAGVFRGFPLHDVASAVAFPSLVMGVLWLSWSFRAAAGWQTIYPVTLLIGVGMLAAFGSLVLDVGMPGLQQRAFLFLLLLWLSIVVHNVVRARV